MKCTIIDAHTHVQFRQFDNDRSKVIARALDAGIGMINAGSDMQATKEAIALACQYDYGVWATAGLHPHEADKSCNFNEFAKMAADKHVVAIGECGLDYFRIESGAQKEAQKDLFVRQIELSGKLNKPLVIHCREAFGDVLDILRHYKDKLPEIPGVCHFFTGTVNEAQEFLALGFSFTFGGLITFNREFDEVLQYIPLKRIMAETDAPFVSPASHRGERNEPLYVKEVVEMIARVRGEDEKKVHAALLDNTKRVFGLDI